MSQPLLAALDAAHAHQPGSFVMAVADAERNVYAQFAPEGDALLVEVVGNAFLDAQDHLGLDQEAEMRARGWALDEAGNWSRTYARAATPGVRREAALDALTVLAEVHGAAGDLHVLASIVGPEADEDRASLRALGVEVPEAPTLSGAPLAVLLIGGGLLLVAVGWLLL